MKSLAESSQVWDGCFTQLQDFQVSQVVGLGTDEQVVFQVGVDVSRRDGLRAAKCRGG